MKKFRGPKKPDWKVSGDTIIRNRLHETTKKNKQKIICIYGHIQIYLNQHVTF